MASSNGKRMQHPPIKYENLPTKQSATTSSAASTNDSNKTAEKFGLCLMNFPNNFDETKIIEAVKSFGPIQNWRKSNVSSCPFYFADCSNKQDYDAILKGMRNNPFGIKVLPAKQRGEYENTPPNNQQQSQSQSNDNTRNTQRNRNKSSTRKRGVTPINNRRDVQQNARDRNQFNRHQQLPDMNEKNFNHHQNGYNNYNHPHPEPAFKNLHKSQTNNCVICNKNSTKICPRCNENYCSTECQIKDWPNHKFYCFRMPMLYDTDTEKYEQPINTNTNVSQGSRSNNVTTVRAFESENLGNNSSVHIQQKIPGKIINSKFINNHKQEKTPQRSYNDVMKPVIRNEHKSDAIVINNPERAAIPSSGQKIVLTYVEQVNLVFVRSNENNDHENYLKIISQVEKSAAKSKVLTKVPKIGEYVIGHDGTSWSRAIVISNELKDHIFIAYVDFGNCEYKKLSDLRELLPECYNLMRYPGPVYLKNLENYTRNEKFTEYMNSMVNSFKQLKITYNSEDPKNDKIMAELWDFQTNENINNKCIELLKPVESQDNAEPFWLKDLVQEILPVGENISVFILDEQLLDVGIITCIPVDAIDELDKLNDELKKYAGKTSDVYMPKENELCVAKYSDDPEVWYRAACFEKTDNESPPVLSFIDYGNTCPVPVANIRKFSKSFTLPCKTAECQIAGLEHLMDNNANEKLHAKLGELLPLYIEIVISKVENINGESNLLHLPKVIEAITNAGLL